MKTSARMPQSLAWVGIATGYLLALAPLPGSWLVTEWNFSAPTDRLAYTVLPVVLGFLGLIPGIRNLQMGRRGNGIAQIILTVGCTLWSLVIAGFALAVTHGRGV